ncbi:MAG: IMPACT family protein [Gammaproteobacteria bacterium]
MYCVRTPSSAEEIIKKSRFIGYLIPCSSTRDVHSALNRLAAEHLHATHIAFAFRIKTESGIVSRFFDAGEPGGTAGKPIYQHIEGRDLINCLIAVVRYFGGTKLGAGGLTRAYGNAARNAIEINTLYPFVEFCTLPVTIDYARLQDLEYQITNLGGSVVSRSYTERIDLVVSLPRSALAEFEKFLDAKRSS